MHRRSNDEHVILQLILRVWPFKRGINRIVGRLLKRLRFQNEFDRVRTTDGFSIQIMPNDLIGSFLYLTGEFDRSIIGILFEQARPGDTLLDIGANIGYVSGCFLNNITNSKVIAIEPQPIVSELLEKNLSEFPGRYQIARVALSNRDGEGYLALCSGNSGHCHLANEVGPDVVEIEVWSVQRLIATLGIERAELIKIDVEGHEREVIEGLVPHLFRLRSRAILFEDHMKQAGRDGSIGTMLCSEGYKIFRIKKRMAGIDLIPVYSAADCTSPEFIAIKGS